MAQSLEAQKIAGAMLTGAILAVGSSVIASMIYAPHRLEHNAYQVDVSVLADNSAAASDGGVAPIGERLATADPAKGAATAKVCLSCHTFDQGGANKTGPNLYNTVGEEIGQGKGGFAFSPALSSHGGKWDFQSLDHFLTNPKAFAPGTKMSFAGLSKAEQRANVIAYLRSLSPNPVPLPDKAAPAPAEGADHSGDANGPPSTP